MRRSGIGALVAVVVFAGVAAPAEALTKKQAKRAVKREVYQSYEVKYPTIRCTRLTSRQFKCRWEGLSDADVYEGNTDGWAGTARVREYRGGAIDVSLHVTRYGE